MIGIFDSGSGGLTVLSAIRKKAPSADVVYFGDVANAPYGSKSSSELLDLTHKGIEFLTSKGATTLVSACNSISSLVLGGATREIPYIEMSTPTGEYLKTISPKRFLLIATPATIESGLYERALGSTKSLDSLAIPELAGALEFGASQIEVEDILHKAFSDRKTHQYDALILGCTHYPLVLNLIRTVSNQYFGPLDIIDPAYPVADEVVRQFETQGSGITQFYLSKESEPFRKRVSDLFPGLVYSVDIIN